MFQPLVLFSLLVCAYASVEQAVVVLKTNDISGRITFTKTSEGLKVNGTITGLPQGKHGFHIHEKGDLDNNCVAAGGHFNPEKKDHGAPTDDNRHVGDLGNIEADANKVANINIVDKLIALDGVNCIIGRALVIHAGEDDLGRGGFEDSKTTGHAGARLACGVVGLVEGNMDSSARGTFTAGTYFLITTLLYFVNRL